MFDAYPKDNIDDSNEIQLVIYEAISYGLNVTIAFGFGIDQTLLIGTSIMSIFYAQYFNGLKITSLSIDFDPLSFTTGYVVNSILVSFSTDILRIPLASQTEFTVGDDLVTVYSIFIHGIVVIDSTDFIIQSIDIFIHLAWSCRFFQLSLYWHEGPASRNVTLAENLFINCNEGIGQEQGLITILPNPVQLVPVICDIGMESSILYFGRYTQGLIQANNANNLFLNDNYTATNSSRLLISICNSRNLTASNNTTVTTQSKIDEYYIFDKTHPCQMNLSSLIDLPASAFNSSFPPPVIIADSSHPNQKHKFVSDNNKTHKIPNKILHNL
ncbi:unnamed protein product [Rotaria sp. Silwood1]|nr:unnamed protein product [Rotaria sp. Silwood1]